MSNGYLDPPEWYASLPTFFVSAAMLFTDRHDQILLVKPNYRAGWSIPGGIVEAGEAPHEGAAREVAEELGLDVSPGDLLVVDWIPPGGERPRALLTFIFDGGTLHDPAQIRLQKEELDEARFWSWEEAATRLPAAGRLPAARRARERRRTVYLPFEV